MSSFPLLLYSGGNEDPTGTLHGNFRQGGRENSGLPGEKSLLMILPAEGAAFGRGGQELHFACRQGEPAIQVISVQQKMRISDQQGAPAAGQVLCLLGADGNGIDI